MINLIWKDMISQIKYLSILLVIYAIFFSVNTTAEFIISIAVILIAFRLAYLEDKNNTLLLFKTMPLKSSTIVFSKFFSILLIGVFFILLSMGYLGVIGQWNSERIVGIIASVTVVLVMSGLFFALFFKMGYAKSSLYIRIIFLLVWVVFMVPAIMQYFITVLKFIGNHIPLTWVTGVVVEVCLIGIYLLLGVIATIALKRQEV